MSGRHVNPNGKTDWERIVEGWNSYEPPPPRYGTRPSVQVPRTSNFFHLFMTIVTGGLWLIVWFLAASRTKRLRHEQVLAALESRQQD